MAQKKSSTPAPEVPVVVPDPTDAGNLLGKAIDALRCELREQLYLKHIDADYVRAIIHDIARFEVLHTIFEGDLADEDFLNIVEDRFQDTCHELIAEQLVDARSPAGHITTETVAKLQRAIAIAQASIFE